MTRESQIAARIDTFKYKLGLIYQGKGKAVHSELVKDSEWHLEEDVEYDNWNGGTYGHALNISIAEAKFTQLVSMLTKLEEDIRDDLREMIKVPNEYILTVSIEPLMPSSGLPTGMNESESGSLRRKWLNENDIKRVWGDSTINVFLSHRSTDKKIAAGIKKALSAYGVSCFVAHEDIEPAEEWLKEIENALVSMDIMLAVVNGNFFSRHWTNQEVGIAYSRGVPIIPVKCDDVDPQGFIGKLQAIPRTHPSFAEEIVRLLLKYPSTRDKAVDGIINALKNSSSWETSSKIAQTFDHIRSINELQEDGFVEAFNKNSDVRSCIDISNYDINGNQRGGDKRLDKYMNKWTNNKYTIKKVKGLAQLVKNKPIEQDTGAPF